MDNEEIVNDNISKDKQILSEIRIVYLYRKYPSQQKAVKKYKEKHKDEIREYSKNYQRDRYLHDEEYREKRKQKALERYYLKKSNLVTRIDV